jgi:hypothetical protein
MAIQRRATVAAIAVALVLGAAGCGSGSSVSDSKIVNALGLKQTGSGYQMNGDPFCTIEQLLNDPAEVASADKNSGNVLAGPKGRIGIVVKTPFAPSCARKAKDALGRLERQSQS